MTPEELSSVVNTTLAEAVAAGDVVLDTLPDEVRVERPKSREHGDWATNIALQLAKPARMNPRQLAEILATRLSEHAGISAVDIAGPGFINITLDAAAAGQLAQTIVEAGDSYGHNTALSGHTVNLEYVSANPTGPLHMGHTRWAAVGDAIARVLRASGAAVTAEYYINDAGNQMNVFAASVLAAIHGEPTPEGGYPGEYIQELARQVVTERPEVKDLPRQEALPVVRELAYTAQMAQIRKTLAAFHITFDVYFSEKSLHDAGKIEEAVSTLRAQGHVYDHEGAVFLRTTDFGDDKDRVLIKADGEPTYFAADAAYYLSKRDRGFEEKIYLLGADHHGYIGRLKAIAACAGDAPERNIEILIGQLISVKGARLSKRAGNMILLEDLIEWLGADALRYTLARSPADSPLDVDPDLLQSKTNDNPVFYVQYAHARACNAARNAEAHGVGHTAPDGTSGFDAALLSHEREEELLAHLAKFPNTVARAAQLREPHRVARYLEDLAAAYHAWYAKCRIAPSVHEDGTVEEVTDLNRSRLWLNSATVQVLRNGLALLGVTAPEKM
ncbi:arginine--tRNA ligase [Nesterenkonia alkaliphila]|uniref:Arginine--tRNA ligase n=1 Tax=Nesterenkonia alkaliphila TaxID=1463631 RepID=A0A7K1UFT6_9MICC|nr:arginine--tRNA ligase [Nesterenkonia alkaliphila]MVT25330.1 arginine--tRNA ligase [Nesterenkonia alkaliphila]GFZ94539.1 arginine--tRNA ligase [Nesterenkonia alkaliphila]